MEALCVVSHRRWISAQTAWTNWQALCLAFLQKKSGAECSAPGMENPRDKVETSTSSTLTTEASMDKRNYLLLINISEPQPEHRKIKPALEEMDPDVAFVYFDKHGACVLMKTHLAARQIEARLLGAVLNSDRRLIAELGPDWQTFGLDKAAMWFQRNQIQK